MHTKVKFVVNRKSEPRGLHVWGKTGKESPEDVLEEQQLDYQGNAGEADADYAGSHAFVSVADQVVAADEQAQRRKDETEDVADCRVEFRSAFPAGRLPEQFRNEAVFFGFAEVLGLVDFPDLFRRLFFRDSSHGSLSLTQTPGR